MTERSGRGQARKLWMAVLLLVLGIVAVTGNADAAAVLDGQWQSQTGQSVVFQQGQFQYLQAGQVVDAGRYMLQGNMMTTQSTVNGMMGQFRVQLDGNMLYLQNMNGITVFQRVPETPSGPVAGLPPSGAGTGLSPQQGQASSQSAPTPGPGKAAMADNRPGGSSSNSQQGNVFRHPVGFQFLYPAGWTIKDHYDFIELLPPNPASSVQGKEELYILFGEPVAAEGISRPEDPRIGQYLDSQVGGLSSLMQRTGQPTPVRFSMGNGASYEWQGQAPTGQKLYARANVGLINGYGMALLAYGLRERIESRHQELRSMFNSFGFGQGQKDPRLIGNWRLVNTESSHSFENDSPFESDYSRTKMSSASETSISFNGNGTWEWKYYYSMVAQAGEESSAGEELGQVFLSDEKEEVKKGRWNAGDGVLFRIWDDGTWEDYRYTIARNGQGTILKMATNKNVLVWQKEN